VNVPLDAIDRSTLLPLPPVSAAPEGEKGTATPAAPGADERRAIIEQAPAPTSSSTPETTRPTTTVREVTRLQAIPPASNPDAGTLDSGSVELMVLGSFTGVSAEGETGTSVNVNAFLGVFATPHVELGMSTSVMKLADIPTGGSLMGHLFFNFPNSSAVVPFVGGGVGTTFGNADFIGHPLALHLSGGFRVLMPGAGGALIIRPFYERANVSSDFIDTSLNTYGVAVGASLLF
jgi:hypothetical protein